ncbi:MAG: phosphoribosylamine--glycine ligase [Phycisphaerales bacterium]|nr:phosphoribosylamine--glycine ligase [Phycisphaerales bacterium]
MATSARQSVPDTCNILLVGGGGREHALAWKLKESDRCGMLWATDPGNGGLAGLVKPCPHQWNAASTFELTNWCDKNDIHLVVVGPEVPLSEGIADTLATEGRLVFGPGKEGAQLEADKIFAKEIMREASVPTAEGRSFDSASAAHRYLLRNIDRELQGLGLEDEAKVMEQWFDAMDSRDQSSLPSMSDTLRDVLAKRHEPVVVKASGLAAGKGVVVCDTTQQALDAVDDIMVDAVHGDAGARIIIEEVLEGQEASVLALVDGNTIWVLDPCQDHKQVGEGDVGPNTGGMGAYCPTPVVDGPMLETIEQTVLLPIVDALKRRDIEFRGVLYAGMMLTPGGPKVLEFNVRFGDPECQPLMARLQGDLVEILWLTAAGRLSEAEFSFDDRTACCVVLCSEGYPGPYSKARAITGIESAQNDDVTVFHAGTVVNHEGTLVTSGGRVLGVTALADDLHQAQQLANTAAAKIHFDGAFYRSDIGHRVANMAPTESA